MARTERSAGGAGVVGVVGARGGAGATVTGAALAAELARRGTAVLVDTGVGPSLDTVLGLEGHPGLRWPDLTGARGSVDPVLLAGNLMRWGRCAVLPTDDQRPGPPPTEVLPDVLRALASAYGSVVLDLDRAALLAAAAGDGGPRGDGGDAGAGAVGSVLLAACRTVLVVVPRDVPSVAGARLLRDGLVGDGRRVGLVARGPAPGGLGADEVAAAVGLPVVASLPWARGLGAAVDRGVGPALPTAAARAVARLARRLT
ncbi:pilus assembly protein FlpE [Cellulomonas pakistanensis]|uniref:pilus assembly protein FlpE n=1 Tax=Cellulomonas pakistanensis TaxID=992287 RepID=UPI001942A698|nr:pilus assembly protein FlpE [Cellulomonas pakistanensis]